MANLLPQQAMGYDRAITVFAPDGRLLQVEYAKKAVSLGVLTLGIIYKDGILLMADRRLSERLLVADSVKKIAEIDEHIISSFSGYMNDARVIIKRSRVFAQQYKLTYGEPPAVEDIVKYISDIEQQYTQYGGIRPFGVSFLFGGVDKTGIRLFETDPSGIYTQYYAKSIGGGAPEANAILEKKWKQGLSSVEAQKLALDIFKEVLGKEFSLERLEAAAVNADGKMQKVELVA